MITRRFVLTGLVAAPAVIMADKLMPVHSLPERYATVYGVGWDLEVIEHPIWEPMSAAYFGGTRAIDQFREVTDFVYNFPIEPIARPVTLPHWHREPTDPIKRFDAPVKIQDNGFSSIAGFKQLNEWREAQRPDLDGRMSLKWVQEQIAAERKYGV